MTSSQDTHRTSSQDTHRTSSQDTHNCQKKQSNIQHVHNANNPHQQSTKHTSDQYATLAPQKAAPFRTPTKRAHKRKMTAQPEKWKTNVRKRFQSAGKEYDAATGKTTKERHVKPQDCTKCRYKCSVHINEEERKEIFNSY